MLIQFRHLYPDGSLISKLVTIDHGNYIVKVSVKVAGTTLATGLAAAQTVEMAEDRARERALATLIMAEINNNDRELKSQTELKQSLSSSQVEVVQERKLKPEEVFATNLEVEASGKEVVELGSQAPLFDGEDALPTVEESFEEDSVPDSFKEVSPLTSVASVSDNGGWQDSTLETEPAFQDERVDNFAPEESVSESETTSSLFETDSLEATELEFESNTDDDLPDENSFEPSIMPATSTNSLEVEEITFNEIIDQSDREMKRLGWTKETGKEFLKAHYGKKSRLHLNDEELLAFLQYLQSLPTPE